jgi:hypothetical protein
MMRKHNFFLFVGSTLLVTALLKVVGSFYGNPKFLNTLHELFQMQNKQVLQLIAVIEITGGLYLITSRDSYIRSIVTLFFGGNFLIYRLLSGDGHCPCLGNLGDFLGISAVAENVVLYCFVALCIVGGIFSLSRSTDPEAN